MRLKHRRIGRVTAALVMATGVALGAASVAGAATAVDDITTSPADAKAGDSVTISGKACEWVSAQPSNALITITPDGGTAAPLATVQSAEDTGEWSYAWTPDAAGKYEIAVTCANYDIVTIWGATTEVEIGEAAPSNDGSLSETTVKAGDQVTVTAKGFDAGEEVTVELHSDPIKLGTAKADEGGVVTGAFTIPATVAAGQHNVVLTGSVSGRTVSLPITITAASTGDQGSQGTNGSGDNGTGSNGATTPVGSSDNAPAGRLAFTGGSSLAMGTAGLLALAGGAAIFFATRRRPGEEAA